MSNPLSEPMPCPWCGQTPKVIDRAFDGWAAMCRNDRCEVQPEANGRQTEAEAIVAWNTRAPSPDRDELKAVVEKLNSLPRFVPLCTKCSADTPVMMVEEGKDRGRDVIHRDGRWVRHDQLIAALAAAGSPVGVPTREEKP